MTESTIRQGSKVIWQEWKDNESPEPAILIEPFRDTIGIRQADSYISINWHSIPELIKALKSIERPQ